MSSPADPGVESAGFDYRLPPERIAQRPLPRGSSRLLVVPRHDPPIDRRIGDLVEHLRPGDLLVLNDTRVVPARLLGERLDATGAAAGAVELLLVEPVGGGRHRALARPGRRTPAGTRLRFRARDDSRGDAEGGDTVEAEIEGRDGEYFVVCFPEPGPDLARFGRIPLPPYIRRADDEDDGRDYQTVFARAPGAIAAPTAGLHFTQELFDRLERHGVSRTAVTLHVGPATFLPLGPDAAPRNPLPAERCSVDAETAAAIAAARDRGGRVVAVGTTVVRTLEWAADETGAVLARDGATDLVIRPGHRFQVIDLLLTNFHLPHSTLLLLVEAFAGRERIAKAYRAALERGYRFYSYGDAMLVEGATR